MHSHSSGDSAWPVNMLQHQVVGRLVQKQYIWLFKEKLSQKHLGSLPTWQRSYIRIHSKVHDTKGTRHFVNLSIKVKITTLQTVLKFSTSSISASTSAPVFSHFHIGSLIRTSALNSSSKLYAEHHAPDCPSARDWVLIQVTRCHIFGPLNLPSSSTLPVTMLIRLIFPSPLAPTRPICSPLRGEWHIFKKSHSHQNHDSDFLTSKILPFLIPFIFVFM